MQRTLVRLGWLLGACASTALAVEPSSCSAQAGFDRGHAGIARTGCAEAPYREAWRLGQELALLEEERATLQARQSALAPAQARATSRRIRQLEIDIEAIAGALQLRGIVQEGPRVEQAGDAGDSTAQGRDGERG